MQAWGWHRAILQLQERSRAPEARQGQRVRAWKGGEH